MGNGGLNIGGGNREEAVLGVTLMGKEEGEGLAGYSEKS